MGTGKSVGPPARKWGHGTFTSRKIQVENKWKWDVLETDEDIFVQNWIAQYDAKQGSQVNTTKY